MARVVSFVVLIAILLVIGTLFFQVMAIFMLPMFMALLLVVMFDPVHRWFLKKCHGRYRVAALLTTATILLIVLIPLVSVIVQATFEGIALYDRLGLGKVDPRNIAEALVEAGDRLGFGEGVLSVDKVETFIREKTEQYLPVVAAGAARFLVAFLIALVVMVVALYYFLADGPGMLRAIRRVTPLDDAYEERLIREFVVVCRAVVVATLLSAIAQGCLAGIGFWVISQWYPAFTAVTLLTVMTTLFAMVPFVCAAAVWLPTALWLFFIAKQTGPAIFLAIYGTCVVSTIDNVIKPIILHGRASLHPLLALLSVLGGVQALGPIGIFVGPMAVAFLQAVLQMLRSELDAFSEGGKFKPIKPPGKKRSPEEPGEESPDSEPPSSTGEEDEKAEPPSEAKPSKRARRKRRSRDLGQPSESPPEKKTSRRPRRRRRPRKSGGSQEEKD